MHNVPVVETDKMATPTSLEQGKDVWHAYVSKKTEAMPKNSLFGTALEKTNSKPVELIDSAVYEAQEMKERQEKFEQYEHKLPERLKNVRGMCEHIIWCANI